jgi:hypothetical protein
MPGAPSEKRNKGGAFSKAVQLIERKSDTMT